MSIFRIGKLSFEKQGKAQGGPKHSRGEVVGSIPTAPTISRALPRHMTRAIDESITGKSSSREWFARERLNFMRAINEGLTIRASQQG